MTVSFAQSPPSIADRFLIVKVEHAESGCCKVASGESIRRNKNVKPAGAG
jgi:hypothetical protein